VLGFDGEIYVNSGAGTQGHSGAFFGDEFAWSEGPAEAVASGGDPTAIMNAVNEPTVLPAGASGIRRSQIREQAVFAD
jgi:hypothetical protein